MSRSQGYSLVATEEEEFASWGYGVDEDELAFGFDDDNGGAEGCCSAGCCSGLTDHAKVLVIAICAFACITVAQTVRAATTFIIFRALRDSVAVRLVCFPRHARTGGGADCELTSPPR